MDESYDHNKWVLGSCIISLIGYYIISPIISPMLANGYVNLPDKVKIIWHTLTVSNIHVVVVCPLCFYVLLTDLPTYEDHAWGKSFMSQLPLAITVGYILSDTIVLLHKFEFKEARSYLVHHFSTVLNFWGNIVCKNMMFFFLYQKIIVVEIWGPLTYFAVLRLLAELSTPFVNQRYFLDVLGKKTSSAYVVNGVLLTIVFFLVRIIVIPPYYQFVYGILTTRHIHHIHWGFLCVWVGGSVMLDILNVWWFRKIVKGALKTVLAARSAKTDVGEENGDGDAVRNRVKGE